MPKYRIKFSETVTYEAVIDSDEPIPPIEDIEDESDWFPLLDDQHPKWYESKIIEVEDRDLLEITEITDEQAASEAESASTDSN